MSMLTLLSCAVVTCLGCYPVMRLLQRAGRVDAPNTRSSHAVPTPRGGGIALLAGIAAAALAALVLGPIWSTVAWVAVLGSTALALVGLTDDLVGLKPQPRLVAQALIGVITGMAVGGWRAGLLGALVVPAAVNMVNFMDGINGICAGHAAVWGLGAMAASGYAGGDTLMVLGVLSLGCGLGFLPWNVPKARLFLGDVGSYLIGGLAGMGVLVAIVELLPGGNASTPWPLLGLVCGPYLLFAVDTASTMLQRARAGQRILVAHRGHVYQRLANERGRAHWAISLSICTVSLVVTVAFSVSTMGAALLAVITSSLYLASPTLLRRKVPA